MDSIIKEITAERQRQIKVKGFDTKHDDTEIKSQLAIAAACYTLESAKQNLFWIHPLAITFTVDRLWPDDTTWWKPTTPRKNLIKAAALIIAEIERLDRQEVSR